MLPKKLLHTRIQLPQLFIRAVVNAMAILNIVESVEAGSSRRRSTDRYNFLPASLWALTGLQPAGVAAGGRLRPPHAAHEANVKKAWQEEGVVSDLRLRAKARWQAGMKKSAPAAKQDLAAWVSDEFEAKSPAHDDLARVSAAAAAMRGATPPRPPSTASAINKSRNSTPKSIGQSPRESMAALSKSSSKASMSGVQVDMMTAKSEVKPGVMVNV